MFDSPASVDDVIILFRDKDGYYNEDRLTLQEMGNILPSIGDKWTIHPQFGGIGAYLVCERYLINIFKGFDSPTGQTAWILVVEEIENDELFEFDRVVREIFDAEVSEEALAEFHVLETLDRSNRDPAYWTFERKELLRKEREARLAAIQAEEDAKKR